MKIQIMVLTDRDEETGLKFEIPELPWRVAEATFDMLLRDLMRKDKP